MQELNQVLSSNVDKILQAQIIEECRSFTLAAQRIGISQPALSRSIKSLEDALSFKLFRRTQAGVTPTPKGEKILSAARDVLNVLNRTASDLRSIRVDNTAPLRIGTKEPFAIHMWPPFISWLKMQNNFELLELVLRAEIYIDKSNAHLEEQFRNHKLDALLVAAPSGIKGSEDYELFETTHRLYSATHPDKMRSTYAKEQCFLYREAHISQGKALKDVLPAHTDLRYTPVQSFDAARALAIADLGSAILPSWIAYSSVRDRMLMESRSPFATSLAKLPGIKIYFCVQGGMDKTTSNLARQLKRFCREAYLR